MLKSHVKIVNQKGLHARASVKLAELAQSFDASIIISNGKTQADASSVLQIMMLAAAQHSELEISYSGNQAAQAQLAIDKLIDNGFDE